MKRSEVFREEAIQARVESRNGHGDVLLFLPKYYKVIVVLVYTAILAVVLILWLGTYTKRVTVNGELSATLGTIPVYLPRAGLAREYFVSEDDVVDEDDALLKISTEMFGVRNRETSSETLNFLKERMDILQKQLASRRALHYQNTENMNQQIDSLQKEREILLVQLGEIGSKTALLREKLDRYNSARQSAAISGDSIADIQIDSLNNVIDYNSQKRELEILERNVANLIFQRDRSLIELENDEFLLRTDLLTLEEQMVNAESQKGLIVKAPVAGKIIAMQGYVGSYLDNTKPFLFILPPDSKIEAQLLVPASAIGFIKLGDPVYLRYSAFPYQQFGQGRGMVYSISGTSLAANEIMFDSRRNITEPMFIIKVEIPDQHVRRDAVVHMLKPGMQLDADIMIEEYRLYQWILGPLYALTGKFK